MANGNVQQGVDDPMLIATPEMVNRALRQIERAISRAGRTLADYPGMRIPPPAVDDANDDDAIVFNAVDHQARIDGLNVKQHENYDILTNAIINADKQAYFLDCPGGTGLLRPHISTHLLYRQNASAQRRG
jgi:hypothetical protein